MDKSQIEQVVRQVVASLQQEGTARAGANGYAGVYACMQDAVDAAARAQRVLYDTSIEKKEAIIAEIRRLTHAEAETMARMGVEETGMGRVEDKIIKHQLVANKTPGTEVLTTGAITGDTGLTLTEMAPFGVVGAITPSTNPSETVICNSIGMIAAGNTVVFNPHPGAKKVSQYAVDLVNRAAKAAGMPCNLAYSVAEPTLETSDAMTKAPAVKLLVCTGGPGVVKAMLSSGKKAIGAGAGNPPVIVDETADIPKAARDILAGCSFDNNLPCIAEKEVFALAGIYSQLLAEMQRAGAVLLSSADAKRLEAMVMVEAKNGRKVLNRDLVGRSAPVFLDRLGIPHAGDVRCIICEAEFGDLFVQEELMMPILPIVKAAGIDEAIDMAVKAEHGYRHTAHMHSKNIDNLTRFARAIETTIFVKNAPSYAGIGVGGEGWCTFTIAGPTGEGITNAASFTRKRRCVMADSFRIV